MPFVSHGIEALDDMINVRLTRTEKEKLKTDADLASISMSELIRRRYFGRPIIADDTVVILKELHRLGLQLKRIQNANEQCDHDEVTNTLKALKTCFETLSRDR